MPQTDTQTDIDIEALLENIGAHFRSAHIECIKRVIPGQIIEANCGVLYRCKGRRLPLFHDRCQECFKRLWALPCPFCGSRDLSSS